ncbi:MAG: hypothetical protein LUE64_00560 [Candidatus Gastranaerophilales bacterium]|nr:hypothetical protein [Candidatus Gastranaerophilales bacterium]
MKVFFAIAFFMLFSLSSYAAIDDNVDYDFINNAFTDPNPTTNAQFEQVMQQYENPREGFFTKIFKFFDKDKVKYDNALKTQFENPNNQPNRIKDVPEELPTILVSSDSIDSTGKVIKTGYYQLGYSKEGEKYILKLSQGAQKQIATLYARSIDEDEKAPAIVYGRSETMNNGYIKVIYANLDLTLLGFLKIVPDEKTEFTPVY